MDNVYLIVLKEILKLAKNAKIVIVLICMTNSENYEICGIC